MFPSQQSFTKLRSRFRIMQMPKYIAALIFYQLSSSIYYGIAEAHQVNLYVHNKCSFPIWPATAPNSGQAVIADGGFYLAEGQTQHVIAPWTWTGRIWARTGCNFSSNWKPACETGDCDGRLACNGLIGTPPVTLVELSLQPRNPNFYDVSIVDGYNIPVSVTPKITNPKCNIQGCCKDLKLLCPAELQVLNSNGKVVACKSACLAFNNDRFCCRNQYGSPGKCKPSVYSKIFKDACPNYFSYAFDTPTPVVTCAASEFIITFCPYGWGGAADHKSE